MTIKEQEALRLVREAATEAAAAGGLPDFLAELERARSEALLAAVAPLPTPPRPSDETLSLKAAAAFMGEPVETFRRRLDYRKALLRRPGERRLRYARAELERIRGDRLAGNGGA